MREPFAVGFAARHAKSRIAPQFAFVREAARSLNVSNKPTRRNDADTGRTLQQPDFGKLGGSGNHRSLGIFERLEHLTQDGKRLHQHLFDRRFGKLCKQFVASCGRKHSRIAANDAERSQSRFDLILIQIISCVFDVRV